MTGKGEILQRGRRAVDGKRDLVVIGAGTGGRIPVGGAASLGEKLALVALYRPQPEAAHSLFGLQHLSRRQVRASNGKGSQRGAANHEL